MTAVGIGYTGLTVSLILIVVALALSTWQGLGLERSIVGATLRALVQLLIVGLLLSYVIDEGRPLWLSWVWVCSIVIFAATTVARRAPELPHVFAVGLAANVVSVAVSVAVTFGFGIFPLEGRTLVPIAGMVTGNAMRTAVVGARRLVDAVAENRDDIEARLSLGHSPARAIRPTLRATLRLALLPQIEANRTVGLVALPGAMTGLILAGTDPVDAVLVQAALLFLILGAAAMSVSVIGLAGSRSMFTNDERLIAPARTE